VAGKSEGRESMVTTALDGFDPASSSLRAVITTNM
jgi:hypothetical protein